MALKLKTAPQLEVLAVEQLAARDGPRHNGKSIRIVPVDPREKVETRWRFARTDDDRLNQALDEIEADMRKLYELR